MSCCSVDGHGEIKGWNEKVETFIWDKSGAGTSSRSTAVGGDKTTDAAMALCRDIDEKERRRVLDEMNGEVYLVICSGYRWKRQRFTTTINHLTFLQQQVIIINYDYPYSHQSHSYSQHQSSPAPNSQQSDSFTEPNRPLE